MNTRTIVSATLLALALCDATGVAAKEFDPYAIPKDQFAKRVRTIALAPLSVPSDTPNPDGVRTTIETLITENLRSKGYAVVASSVWAGIWRQMSERVGGTFDEATGEVRKEEFDAVWEHTTRELARLQGVDAVLNAHISIGRAPFGRDFFDHFQTWGETLTWHGETVGPELDKAPQAVLGAYLEMEIYDQTGAELYGISVGIEWTSVFVARGYEDKPRAQLYAADRLRRAVAIDLKRLVTAQPREER